MDADLVDKVNSEIEYLNEMIKGFEVVLLVLSHIYLLEISLK